MVIAPPNTKKITRISFTLKWVPINNKLHETNVLQQILNNCCVLQDLAPNTIKTNKVILMKTCT